LAWGDEFFEICTVLREVDLGGDDGVEPALDNVPDTCVDIRCVEYICTWDETNLRRSRVLCG